MTTKVIKDYRKQDNNRTIWTPYWMFSKEIDEADCEDKCALVFEFSAKDYGTNRILIEQIGFIVTEVFAGGTITIDVGSYTIATPAVIEAGNATDVDPDEYIPTASITSGSAGLYWPVAGDWIVQKLLMRNAAPTVIIPSDTDTPCIGVLVASDGAATAGKGRVILQVTEIPYFS